MYFYLMILCATLIIGLVDVINCSKLSDFEIRTLTGEPNYKSVNLTWEIENTSMLNSNESDSNISSTTISNNLITTTITSNSSNSSSNSTVTLENEIEFPKVFQIFYCEIQTFGPHRCRSKIVEDNTIEEDREDLIKHYSTVIDNLRMATKYSFHIKPQIKRKSQQKNQRGMAEIRENEIQTDSMGFDGQTIIIPTKGFSAVATKCLPHASEIEVETGPYFGGKIVVDGGNCGVKGNPKELTDKYVMVIDHEKCGSLVKPQTNTVETFITVQENLGIFTHSTRRFVVVCSFQSGMQTVRASFTIPGKGGVASVEENDPFEPDRNGRSRQFRFVDRSGLVLKENYSNDEETIKDEEQTDSENSIATVQDIIPGVNEDEIKKPISTLIENLLTESETDEKQEEINDHQKIKHAKYSRLTGESLAYNERFNKNRGRSQNNSSNYTTGIVIAVSLSVIMIGVFIYVLKREFRRQTIMSSSSSSSSSTTTSTQRNLREIQKRQILVNKYP